MLLSKVIVSITLIMFAAGMGWFNYRMLMSWDDFEGDPQDVPGWRKNIYKCIGVIVTIAFVVWAMYDFDKTYRVIMLEFVTGRP